MVTSKSYFKFDHLDFSFMLLLKYYLKFNHLVFSLVILSSTTFKFNHLDFSLMMLSKSMNLLLLRLLHLCFPHLTRSLFTFQKLFCKSICAQFFMENIFLPPWSSHSGTPAGPRAYSFLGRGALLQLEICVFLILEGPGSSSRHLHWFLGALLLKRGLHLCHHLKSWMEIFFQPMSSK